MVRLTSSLAVALLLIAAPALGCPICNTGTGDEVRAGIFDGNFAYNLFATLLPFPLLVGIVAFIHFGGPRRRS